MTQPLDTVAGQVSAELVVQRSRFIATLAPVTDEAQAEAIEEELRTAHHAARHHCTALVLGPAGDLQRSDDDGEPSGTAGAPILSALVGAALTDVTCVVTRYFGGTLLGAGGLVRAYGGATSAAISAARRRARQMVDVFTITVGPADAGRLEHRIRSVVEDLGGHVAPPQWGASTVRLDVEVPSTGTADLRTLLQESGIEHSLVAAGRVTRDISA